MMAAGGAPGGLHAHAAGPASSQERWDTPGSGAGQPGSTPASGWPAGSAPPGARSPALNWAGDRWTGQFACRRCRRAQPRQPLPPGRHLPPSLAGPAAPLLTPRCAADERGAPSEDGGRGPHRRQGHCAAVSAAAGTHAAEHAAAEHLEQAASRRWLAAAGAIASLWKRHRLTPAACRGMGACKTQLRLAAQGAANRRAVRPAHAAAGHASAAAAAAAASCRCCHCFTPARLSGRRRRCTRPPPPTTSGCRAR